MTNNGQDGKLIPDVSGNKPSPAAKKLSPAAERALAEAAERRAEQTRKEQQLAQARELDGRGGKDPVRYNDWEIKGLTSDF